MQVILLERVEKLGQMGDVVTVKPGFARNYLLPRKKAMRATKENIAAFEQRRKQLEEENAARRSEAEKLAEKLNGMQVVVIRSAGETGHLYGSVNARDIAAAVSEAGFAIERSQVLMDHPVKSLGFHEFRIRLHPEVDAVVTVNVARTAEEAELQAKLGRAIVSTDEEEERGAREPAEAAAATGGPREAAPETPAPEETAAEGSESAESDATEGPAEGAEAAAATPEEKQSG